MVTVTENKKARCLDLMELQNKVKLEKQNRLYEEAQKELEKLLTEQRLLQQKSADADRAIRKQLDGEQVITPAVITHLQESKTYFEHQLQEMNQQVTKKQQDFDHLKELIAELATLKKNLERKKESVQQEQQQLLMKKQQKVLDELYLYNQ